MISEQMEKALNAQFDDLKRASDAVIEAFQTKLRYESEWSALMDAEYISVGQVDDAKSRVRISARGKELDALLTIANIAERRASFNYALVESRLRIQLLVAGE